MRASKFPFASKKSVSSKEEEVISFKYMDQARFILKHGAGLFTYGPFAQKILERLKSIIREELGAAEATEISMPFVQPGSLWVESGR